MTRGGPCLPARYIFTFLASASLAIIYGLKVNLSVAIVVMVNSTALNEMALTHDSYNNDTHLNESSNSEFACPANTDTNQTDSSQDGPFPWPEPIQGLILGAYFWGYIVTQIPGGRMAEMFSAKWVVWASVFVNVLFTLLTPVAANISYIAVLVVRFIEGLGAGVSMPALQVLLSKWAPPNERNKISSLVYAGMSLGTVIALPFSGILAEKIGWESVFYVQGGLGSIWCILWILLVFDSPKDHPRIHPAERDLFEKCMENGGAKRPNLPVPWKAIATSVPFWALLVAHMCNNFGWYMLLVELPTYMKHILRFNIGKNSLLSAVPYLCLWVFSIIWSNLMDYSKNKRWINTTTVRKLSTGVASLLPALCFIGVSLAGCDRITAVVLMSLGTMFMAAMYCGILANPTDLASNYAGTLLALTNTAATVPGFIVPVFVGALTHGNQTVNSWQIVFFTTAAILLVELIVFTLFSSAEEQPWNQAYTTGAGAKGRPRPAETKQLNKRTNV
ncbi:hypothetical protein GHT06_009163 [Daphnia sinensis]|uniref:Major facilitator superfamily (MFS) profile domain-containing protein n=1 Tax=Daphnia sinensis TaxID=1820382 RepID=A0AAD5L2K6_9CRUS|nr:hypothetical protein GHT06_009163 [Daphnia sinensis]